MIKNSNHSRFKEFICVLLGHDWAWYECETDGSDEVLEEYCTCGRCDLSLIDFSGYGEALRRRMQENGAVNRK